MIEIQGDYLEGGGQILRTAVALSAVTGEACKITNIRKNRPNPGLQQQHLQGINAAAALCNAVLSGNRLHSTELRFAPEKIKSGNIEINIPTAGSIGLVLQPLMIAALHSEKPVILTINGGATNGKWAPPLNYVKYVLLPLLEKMNYKADIKIGRYGYYPKGGAKAVITIHPASLKPLLLTDRGKIISITGISHAAKQLQKSQVAERQAREAKKILSEKLGIQPEIEIKYTDAINPGSALELFALTENSVLGSDGLGERRKKSEDVGKEAALNLLNDLKTNAALDGYAEDQILPYMALAAEKGRSRISVSKITNHTKTNMWVIEKFLSVRFEVENRIITCSPR